jgi:hypothetical protein
MNSSFEAQEVIEEYTSEQINEQIEALRHQWNDLHRNINSRKIKVCMKEGQPIVGSSCFKETGSPAYGKKYYTGEEWVIMSVPMFDSRVSADLEYSIEKLKELCQNLGESVIENEEHERRFHVFKSLLYRMNVCLLRRNDNTEGENAHE